MMAKAKKTKHTKAGGFDDAALRAQGFSPDQIEQRRPAPIEVLNSTSVERIYPTGTTLADALADILGEYLEASCDGLDLTLWRNGVLFAAIEQGPAGRPIVTRFKPSLW